MKIKGREEADWSAAICIINVLQCAGCDLKLASFTASLEFMKKFGRSLIV
jgi:hypothetical protein